MLQSKACGEKCKLCASLSLMIACISFFVLVLLTLAANFLLGTLRLL